tara:strand:- start:5514 stop:6047 length:534 start_codon:yes stop_codon:yes gene_type:complete
METNDENHENQYEQILSTLRELIVATQESHQALFSYIRDIEFNTRIDDQQPKADLGSFMSSNEIETVDLDQVIEDKKSYIHEIKQLPKGKWINLTAKCVMMQEHSTLPDNARMKGMFQDHLTHILFINWNNSPYDGPFVESGKTYRIEGAVTEEYRNEISLVFNKNTKVREIEVNDE